MRRQLIFRNRSSKVRSLHNGSIVRASWNVPKEIDASYQRWGTQTPAGLCKVRFTPYVKAQRKCRTGYNPTNPYAQADVYAVTCEHEMT